MGWSRLVKVGPGWSRLVQAGPGWSRLVQADPGWSRLVQSMRFPACVRTGSVCPPALLAVIEAGVQDSSLFGSCSVGNWAVGMQPVLT